MRTTVIAFLARAGSGKTTASNYLVEKHGAIIVSFAAPLKKLAGALFDLSEDQLYGELKEKPDPRQLNNSSPRQLMQALGNEARKCLGESVWINAALNTINQHKGRLIVIDDCRYPNEAEAIANLSGGHVVKIISPDRNSKADPNHPSEAGVDLVSDEHLFDVITNTQSLGLDFFEEQIHHVLMRALGIFPGELRD